LQQKINYHSLELSKLKNNLNTKKKHITDVHYFEKGNSSRVKERLAQSQRYTDQFMDIDESNFSGSFYDVDFSYSKIGGNNDNTGTIRSTRGNLGNKEQNILGEITNRNNLPSKSRKGTHPYSNRETAKTERKTSKDCHKKSANEEQLNNNYISLNNVFYSRSPVQHKRSTQSSLSNKINNVINQNSNRGSQLHERTASFDFSYEMSFINLQINNLHIH